MKENKISVGLKIISLVEVVIGIFGIIHLSGLLTYAMRSSAFSDIRGILLPALISWSFLFILSVGILFRKKIAWVIHVLGIPIILAILIHVMFFLASTEGTFIRVVLFSVIIGASFLIYLCRPVIKNQFK